ncbi:histidine kinase [Micromonospora sp. WMMD1128]|uniref:sensor histidine kinase n=1 Tax=Micromonospora sp. WMMD1128 TaxID=3015150 RepID=UPI00248AD4AB|nr:histidine kinase [Micromonospora sp. WMMD1128]WBB76754.1 histidine kinase [Micromonospora sp. WMMD1128]
MTDRLPARRMLDTLLTAAVAYAVGRAARPRPVRARTGADGDVPARTPPVADGPGAPTSTAGGAATGAATPAVRGAATGAAGPDAGDAAAGAAVVADERRRIVGELHDLVAHQVAAIGVLATGARRALPRDPAAADRALAAVEETGRAALRELRRLLRVLRADAGPAAELAPLPGLAGVVTLVRQARDAGLPVTLRTEGSFAPVGDGVALAAHRVVREALRNVLRHAGPATASVRLTAADGFLTVEVTDTGRGPASPDRIGPGLVGMRERVALYGGILRTGPAPGGGFRVYARIPLDPAGTVGGPTADRHDEGKT